MTQPTHQQAVAITLNFADHRRKRSAKAFSTLTCTIQPTAGQIVRIGSRTYVVSLGVNLAATIANMVTSINADFLGVVKVTSSTGTTIAVAAKRGGFGGAAIATTTNITGAAWSAAFLKYGV
jgi:hypothetical protein